MDILNQRANQVQNFLQEDVAEDATGAFREPKPSC